MKLLMHICCGPCAAYPVMILKQKNIEFTGYFFNPNIHPIEEFERRKENACILAEKMAFDIVTDDTFQQELWETEFGNIQEECKKTGYCRRCNYCYDIRMKETFRFAKENGFTHVTTSLFVSPYQNHELIKSLCEKHSKETGIDFFYIDFREGFRQGQAMAKELGLYRQKYCGCILSKLL